MPRTVGAKNKPKYINVRLADLNEVFGQNAVISIASFYDGIVNNTVTLKTEDKPKTIKITRIS